MSDDRYVIPRFGLVHGNPSYIKRKLMYSEVWKNIKKILGMHTETKHRNDIIKNKWISEIKYENKNHYSP